MLNIIRPRLGSSHKQCTQAMYGSKRIVAILFSNSLTTVGIPNDWKLANVTPVFIARHHTDARY